MPYSDHTHDDLRKITLQPAGSTVRPQDFRPDGMNVTITVFEDGAKIEIPAHLAQGFSAEARETTLKALQAKLGPNVEVRSARNGEYRFITSDATALTPDRLDQVTAALQETGAISDHARAAARDHILQQRIEHNPKTAGVTLHTGAGDEVVGLRVEAHVAGAGGNGLTITSHPDGSHTVWLEPVADPQDSDVRRALLGARQQIEEHLAAAGLSPATLSPEIAAKAKGASSAAALLETGADTIRIPPGQSLENIITALGTPQQLPHTTAVSAAIIPQSIAPPPDIAPRSGHGTLRSGVIGGAVGALAVGVFSGALAYSGGASAQGVAKAAARGVADALAPGSSDGFSGITNGRWADRILNGLDSFTGIAATGATLTAAGSASVGALPLAAGSGLLAVGATAANLAVQVARDAAYLVGASEQNGIITAAGTAVKNYVTGANNDPAVVAEQIARGNGQAELMRIDQANQKLIASPQAERVFTLLDTPNAALPPGITRNDIAAFRSVINDAEQQAKHADPIPVAGANYSPRQYAQMYFHAVTAGFVRAVQEAEQQQQHQQQETGAVVAQAAAGSIPADVAAMARGATAGQSTLVSGARDIPAPPQQFASQPAPAQPQQPHDSGMALNG